MSLRFSRRSVTAKGGESGAFETQAHGRSRGAGTQVGEGHRPPGLRRRRDEGFLGSDGFPDRSSVDLQYDITPPDLRDVASRFGDHQPVLDPFPLHGKPDIVRIVPGGVVGG